MLPLRVTRALRGTAMLLAMCAIAMTARAEPEPAAEDRALATALFKEGRKLIEDGRVPEACRKFEESQRLDPGGGTLLNLAECHGREGRTATAWAEFTEALAQARRDGRADRAEVASARIAALESQLSRLSIVIDPSSEREGLEVTLDGTDVRRPAWGMAVPVDPGERAIEARAPGMRSWHATVTVHPDGDAARVSVPPLEALPPPSIAPPAAQPDRPVAPRRPSVPLARDVVTAGAGAFGVAGLALGSYFGLHAISLNQQAAAGCPAGQCTNDAAATSQRATSSADTATVLFAVGAVGVAAAAVLLFTRHPVPAAANVTAGAGPHGGWIGWHASF
jgi:hypothetical protein